jgi:hypothetical protein
MKKIYSKTTLAAVILEGDEIALVLKALKGWSPIIKPREEQDQQLDAMRSELEADAPV